MAHLLRRKAKVLIAFGVCAHLGGIPGLANLSDRAAMLRRRRTATARASSTPRAWCPSSATTDNGHRVTLPGLYDTVRALDQVTDVDYYLPGCAPTPDAHRRRR